MDQHFLALHDVAALRAVARKAPCRLEQLAAAIAIPLPIGSQLTLRRARCQIFRARLPVPVASVHPRMIGAQAFIRAVFARPSILAERYGPAAVLAMPSFYSVVGRIGLRFLPARAHGADTAQGFRHDRHRARVRLGPGHAVETETGAQPVSARTFKLKLARLSRFQNGDDARNNSPAIIRAQDIPRFALVALLARQRNGPRQRG